MKNVEEKRNNYSKSELTRQKIMVRKIPDAPAVMNIQLNVYSGLEKGTPENIKNVFLLLIRNIEMETKSKDTPEKTIYLKHSKDSQRLIEEVTILTIKLPSASGPAGKKWRGQDKKLSYSTLTKQLKCSQPCCQATKNAHYLTMHKNVPIMQSD